MRKLALLIAPVMIFGVVSVAPSARAASTKMTLTTRRSSCAVDTELANGSPHARQKRASAGFSWPQAVQVFTPQA